MVDITEALKARSSPAVPAPVPVPTNDAVYQEAGDTGKRTLWSAKIQALQEQLPEQVLMISFRVVFVLMVLSSIAFYILAFRVPIVSIDWTLSMLKLANQWVAKTVVSHYNRLHHHLCCYFLLRHGRG